VAIPVLLILVALWGIFFLWPLVSGRFGETGGRALASVERLRHGLGSIGRTPAPRASEAHAGGAPLGPELPIAGVTRPYAPRPHPALAIRRRRRMVLTVLGAMAALTLLLAAATDATAGWLVALAACTLLVAYLGAVARLEQARRERRDKVRYLPPIEAPTHRVEPPAAARDSVARPG
jgi:hypothetical protein